MARYGIEGETADVRRAALRCVANALLLDSSMRQVFADTGYGGKLAERLKVRISLSITSTWDLSLTGPSNLQTDNSEDEMVTSRILFLSTYDSNLDFEVLINKNSLGDNVNYVRVLTAHSCAFRLTRTATIPTRETIPQVWPTSIDADGRTGAYRYPKAHFQRFKVVSRPCCQLLAFDTSHFEDHQQDGNPDQAARWFDQLPN